MNTIPDRNIYEPSDAQKRLQIIGAIADTLRSQPMSDNETLEAMQQTAFFAPIFGVTETEYMRHAITALKMIGKHQLAHKLTAIYTETVKEDWNE